MLKGKDTYLFDGWCGFLSPTVLLGGCCGSNDNERLGRFGCFTGGFGVARGVRIQVELGWFALESPHRKWVPTSHNEEAKMFLFRLHDL